LLRRWEPRDLGPLAELNADPEVMEHFPSTHTSTESAFLIERMEAGFERDGFGLWAVEPKGEDACVGFVGLNPVPDEMPFAPAVEVGWRLARSHWGRGIATEAALAAVEFGFEQVRLEEIVSFTYEGNSRSKAVMEHLGMTRDPAKDFDHPLLSAQSALRRHVLYRLAGPRC
jgi:RimJ/RimL family protein N-acetyltransferase